MPYQITEYTIPNTTSFSTQLYANSQILNVAVKSTGPVVLVAYILENTDFSTETRTFRAIQTGTQVPGNIVVGDYSYIGTFQINSTTQYHLFEKVRDSSVAGNNPDKTTHFD